MTLRPIKFEDYTRLVALVVGDSGIGKTCLIRTLCGEEFTGKKWEQVTNLKHPWEIMIVSAEGGLLSVADLIKKGRVSGYEVRNYNDLYDIYNLLIGDEETISRFKGNWIFFDSLTEIADQCESNAGDAFPASKDSFPMWKLYTDDMIDMIKNFKGIDGYNMIFTCLPSVEVDQDNKRFIGTDLSGKKLKKRLPSYFDEVFYLDFDSANKKTQKRVMQTQPFGKKPAKDRSRCLDSYEEPNLLKIHDKIIKGVSQNGVN